MTTRHSRRSARQETRLRADVAPMWPLAPKYADPFGALLRKTGVRREDGSGAKSDYGHRERDTGHAECEYAPK